MACHSTANERSAITRLNRVTLPGRASRLSMLSQSAPRGAGPGNPGRLSDLSLSGSIAAAPVRFWTRKRTPSVSAQTPTANSARRLNAHLSA
jgi:hypothetical protein